jgi:hypothetical protein
LSDEKKACELLSNPNNEFCQTLLNKGLCDIAPNVQGLAMAGKLIFFRPARQPIRKLKYRISTKVHQRIFSPGLLMNSEQKADEMHVSPAIAKPTVG